jgi:hypothetical protein
MLYLLNLPYISSSPVLSERRRARSVPEMLEMHNIQIIYMIRVISRVFIDTILLLTRILELF